MEKRELEITHISVKDLSVQTVASTDAKVYGSVRLVVNDFEVSLWETGEAEVMNPKWSRRIKIVLDEGAIQRDSACLLIHVWVKKENATHDEEVGWLSLPLVTFLSDVGKPVVGHYPLESIQGRPTLELGVKLSDKLIPDVSVAATQPTVRSMPANSVVTPPAPLMSPYYFHSPPRADSVVIPPAPLMSPYYFHSPPPANPVVTPITPGNSVIAPYNFHSLPPSPPSLPLYPGHPYPPRPSFYEGLSILQLLLQVAGIINSFQDLVMSTLGDGGDGGAGSI